MSAPKVYLDERTGDVRCKHVGDLWLYWPTPQLTGGRQPDFDQVSVLASTDFTADFKVLFDSRGALDAPEGIAAGSVRALDYPSEGKAAGMTLMTGHVYRAGWFE